VAKHPLHAALVVLVPLSLLTSCDDPRSVQATPASPSTGGSTNAEVQALVADRGAQASLRNSLAAARTYHADASTYEGLTPHEIGQIEPSLAYVRHGEPSTGEGVLSIAVPREGEGQVYAAAALSSSGTCFTIGDDRREERGTSYGVVDDGVACTGDVALEAEDPNWP
jgi:hypothetical protein